MPRSSYFTPDLFRFLRELKANNRREWFEANRARYEAHVKDPMLRFIADFGRHLQAISPYFSADPRPVGGSMFRIYRDIRFARDKSPYKTNVGAHFPHVRSGKDAHAPGFYLHLQPGNSFGGGGLWHPDGGALKKVRDRIVEHSKAWGAIRKTAATIEGDALKRPPAGYDPRHPFVDDLKLKDYYVTVEFSDREVYAPDFMDRYLQACRSAASLVEFLTNALELPW